jgi:hypothetical protein
MKKKLMYCNFDIIILLKLLMVSKHLIGES